MTLAATLARSRPAIHPILVLLATSLGVLIAQIDTSVVSLAVKSIGADLGSGVSEMQWVIDIYNLIYADLAAHRWHARRPIRSPSDLRLRHCAIRAWHHYLRACP